MDSARREDKSLNRPVKTSPFNLAREMYNQLSEKSAISIFQHEALQLERSFLE